MSRRGANWYKREPHAYLGGVRGLPSKLHAVYSVILDLIYDGGGECPNDPKWISGWFEDLGPASVRRSISDLCDIGKLAVEGDVLTNNRATIEAKTDRETREKRRVFGAKGGRMSGERRAEKAMANNDNSDLGEASASTQNEPEKSTVDKKEERVGKPTLKNVSDFTAFWAVYPRRLGKKTAASKFSAAVKSGVSPQHLIDAAARYAAHVTKNRIEEKYIKHPTTWLNQGCWDDELKPENNRRPADDRFSRKIEMARRLDARSEADSGMDNGASGGDLLALPPTRAIG